MSTAALLSCGLLAAAALSMALTALVRRYALARSLIDLPNGRRSHDRPTPRGGGLALAVPVLLSIPILAAVRLVPAGPAAGVLIGALLVAAIGWVDDHGDVDPRVRAAVHLIAAVVAVTAMGAVSEVDVGIGRVPLGTLGVPLSVLGIAWAINLYNFMDGIDGLAAAEAVIAGGAAGAFLLLTGASGYAALALTVAAASAGFLVWNWAPARIFLGDIGSGLLGYLFAVLAVASDAAGAVPVLLWVILLGVFVFDATVTLVRRVFRRAQWYSAHRSHAYQRLVQAGWSHAHVTLAVSLLDFALAAFALAALRRRELMLPAAGAAVALLAWAYVLVERVRPMAPGGDGWGPSLRGRKDPNAAERTVQPRA